MRWLTVIHHLPERTRIRAPFLHDDRAACEPLADALAAIPGVHEVAIRPYTGSILVEHAESVAVATLVDAACAALAMSPEAVERARDKARSTVAMLGGHPAARAAATPVRGDFPLASR